MPSVTLNKPEQVPGSPSLTRSRTQQIALNAAMDQSRLLSPPAVALQVVSAASKPDCRIAEISTLLSQDAALCAKLLKTVNSCLYSLAKPVASVDRAVMVIGLSPLRSLVLGLSLPVLQSTSKPDPILQEYWLSSVAGAVLARELSRLRKLPSPDSDMVAGLLRDIGDMLLQRTFPTEYANVSYSDPKELLQHPCELEDSIIGINHADLGAELLRKWNLPEEVFEPIRFHHYPERLIGSRRQLSERAELLYLADMLSKIDIVVEYPDVLQHVLDLAERSFGLNQQSLVKFLERISPKLAEFANLLKLDVGNCPDYAGILNQGQEVLGRLTGSPQMNAQGMRESAGSIPTMRLPRTSDPMADTGIYDIPSKKTPLHRLGGDIPDFTTAHLERLPAEGCLLGDYKLEKLLGYGSMGYVFRAKDLVLERNVAIKILIPSLAAWRVSRERFAREARTAAAIRHENVISIYAVRGTEESPYLVMEYIEGGSLEDLLAKKGPLPIAELGRYGKQIAAGLAAAHTRKIVHRDIKPANIMLDNATNSIKLTDFGLARSESEVKLTSDGMLVGTPLFMSPEQVRGEVVDGRSDLFAFGAVLYQLATGVPTFSGTNLAAIFLSICETEPKMPRLIRKDLPLWLERIITKLLHKKPQHRYQTAEEVISDFNAGLMTTAATRVW